ncbi:MAG: U32 family peptidase [Magnetococcales bacterium]|nr:U32 family peptidase [Magnetococcales bacterium]
MPARAGGILMAQKLELLAPAGTWETLKAVIEAGADAVYVAGKRFAMRQHGAWLNFEENDLPRVIDHAHEHGVRCYLALNNLLTDAELALLEDWVPQLVSMKPDALIIQDLGALRLFGREQPVIPLHASTMMSIHHSHGAQILKEYGVTRIIASRDITLQDAARLGQESGLEVEYFVHGDMCVAQGSQCFHSGIATGMSANRGKCLKSCRWSWSLIDRREGRVLGEVEDQYLLARNDLCLYHQIPELAASGIRCLKIEGRARPADYLQPIVAAYRQAIDRYHDDAAGYLTDFSTLNRLKRHTLREVNTGHAFHRPGPGSSGLSGEREPRFFSIVIHERPWEENLTVADERKPAPPDPVPSPPALGVRCGDPQTADAMLAAPCDWIYVGGEQFVARGQERWRESWLKNLIAAGKRAGKRIGIATPRITTQREFLELGRLLEALSHSPPDEYRVSNVGALAFMRQHTSVPVHGDYGLNPWNRAAVAWLHEAGAHSWTPGLELPLDTLLDLAHDITLPMEVVVHGALPGMLLEYCPIGVHVTKTTRTDPCSGPCVGGQYALRDMAGGIYWLEADQYCRNHLFMASDLCALDRIGQLAAAGVARIRIEGQLYEPEYLHRLIVCYREALDRVKAGLPLASWAMEHVPQPVPRPLTGGVFGHKIEVVSQPLTELPTNLTILHAAPQPRKTT